MLILTPRIATVCGNLSYHKMMSSGWGSVYLADGSSYIVGGCAWQCANCNLVMVTEGDIYFGQMTTIGKWATAQWDDKINGNGCIMDIPSSKGYCGSNVMDGYKFFIQ